MKTSAFKSFFIERVPQGCASRRYHGLVCHDWMRQRRVMVIWPFNYAVQLAVWIDHKWCEFINRPSWIDAEVQRRFGDEREKRQREWFSRLMERTVHGKDAA